MARTKSEKRPDELLQAITGYVIKTGLSNLSLRPLAKAVGVSPRVLLYYFGSKEEIVEKIFIAVREWQTKTLLGTGDARPFAEICWSAWREVVRPANLPGLHFFFEAYGHALRDRKSYRGFLQSSFNAWIDRLTTYFSQSGFEAGHAASLATITLSGLRGFVLDYCATRDRDRIESAIGLWISCMEAQMASIPKAASSPEARG